MSRVEGLVFLIEVALLTIVPTTARALPVPGLSLSMFLLGFASKYIVFDNQNGSDAPIRLPQLDQEADRFNNKLQLIM